MNKFNLILIAIVLHFINVALQIFSMISQSALFCLIGWVFLLIAIGLQFYANSLPDKKD
jgi:hypothetical protein